jgi:hypothetical protein
MNRATWLQLQDRLIKELAKSGLTEIEAANAWIRWWSRN